MPHVSRKRMSLKAQKVLNKLLTDIFTTISKDKVEHIFNTLLSKTEKTMLAKRPAVILLLNENYTQEQIAQITKTTRETVSRMKLQLLDLDAEDLNYLNIRLNKWGRKNNIKSLIKSIANIDISKSSFGRKLSKI